MDKRREYTDDQKARALAILADGGTVAGASRETGVPPTTIRNWRRVAAIAEQTGHVKDPNGGKGTDTSWHLAFLTVMTRTCNVSESAALAGVSRSTAYAHRDQFPEFAEAWDDAEEQGVDVLEKEARRRALEGVEEPVFYKGEVCGHVQKYSDTLMIVLLKAHRPDKFRERQEITGKDGAPLIGGVAITEIVVEKPATGG